MINKLLFKTIALSLLQTLLRIECASAKDIFLSYQEQITCLSPRLRLQESLLKTGFNRGEVTGYEGPVKRFEKSKKPRQIGDREKLGPGNSENGKNDPWEIMFDYIMQNYPGAKKIVEIGIGMHPHLAGKLKQALPPDTEIVVTDIVEAALTNAQELYPGLITGRDDITVPDWKHYFDAQLIYSVRPFPGLAPYMLNAASQLATDLVLVIPIGEEMDTISSIGQPNKMVSGFPYSLFIYEEFSKTVSNRYGAAGEEEREKIFNLLCNGADIPQYAPMALKTLALMVQGRLLSKPHWRIAKEILKNTQYAGFFSGEEVDPNAIELTWENVVSIEQAI